ncbi:MAG: deacylase [Deltaproteobacteria bacterium]|nr:deacylase [Deltaproteobacteria bacterium]
MIVLTVLLAAARVLAGENLDFSLHKLESGHPGPTLLVVGGIQGDEPGGFNAASLLATNYRIRYGNVWIVPNLNFISIINRSRGVHGDMNRKFAAIAENDPEYTTIKKIKPIICDEQVDLILNLHDGSGFYRPNYVDKKHNPRRWGQSLIIDQAHLNDDIHGNLEQVARQIVGIVNQHLLQDEHIYHVKNTRTREGNKEMEKTLTYFSIQNNKPAFGVEVSKSFPTHKRAYYHLRVIEAYMDLMGIEYEKNFTLDPRVVKTAINTNIQVAMYNNRIIFDMSNARKRLGYVPLKKNAAIDVTPSNPLIAVVGFNKGYKVYYGNRRLTRLYPDYCDYDESIDRITMEIDGKRSDVTFGNMVHVNHSFQVLPQEGYRVNVIGYRKSGVKNESGIPITKREIQKRFSIDKSSQMFRVEVYRKKKFSGMVLVNFDNVSPALHAATPNKVSLAQRTPLTKIQ